MYRKSLQEEKMGSLEVDEQPQFLNRVVQLPVVATAFDQLTSIYCRTKESNRLMKYTLQTAESGVMLATKTAQPVITRLETPIGKLDHLACDQLEKLETRYPLITKPTDEVYDTAIKPTVEQVNATIKPSVDAYKSAKQYGTDTVTSVKAYTSAKVGDLQQYTYSTLDGVRSYGVSGIDAALATTYGKVLNQSFDSLLDVTDSYVDHYMPAEEVMANGDQAALTPERAATLARFQRLCNKLQYRMSSRARRQVTKVQAQAHESIDKLRHTVDVMQHVREHLSTVPGKMSGMSVQLASLPQSTRDRLTDLWQEINKSEEQAAEQRVEDSEYPPTLERRLVSTARHLTQRLKTTLTILSSSSQVLPEAIQKRLTETRKMTEDLYYMFTSTENKFEGVTGIMVERSRTYLNAISDGLSQVSAQIPTISPLFWLSKEKEVDEVEMEALVNMARGGTDSGSENGAEEEEEEEEEGMEREEEMDQQSTTSNDHSYTSRPTSTSEE